MTEFYSINRFALIVSPKAALISWVNSVFTDDPMDYAEVKGEQHDQMDVFLIPEFDDLDDALSWVKNNCEEILGQILDSWCTDEEYWPENLDWDLFERFLDYSIQTMVTDTVGDEEETDN